MATLPPFASYQGADALSSKVPRGFLLPHDANTHYLGTLHYHIAHGLHSANALHEDFTIDNVSHMREQGVDLWAIALL